LLLFLLTHSYFYGRIHTEKLFYKNYADSVKVLAGVLHEYSWKEKPKLYCNSSEERIVRYHTVRISVLLLLLQLIVGVEIFQLKKINRDF